jgi:hypothetical protein
MFFTLYRKRGAPYGPIHVCLSVCLSRFRGSTHPAWPGVSVPMGVLKVQDWGYSICMIWDDAAKISDHICTEMTNVMWREEHLWNVTLLQRVHLFNLVSLFLILKLMKWNLVWWLCQCQIAKSCVIHIFTVLPSYSCLCQFNFEHPVQK